jgi:hypothetical protein
MKQKNEILYEGRDIMKKKVWAIFIGTAVSMALVACGPSNTSNEYAPTPAMTAAISSDEGQAANPEDSGKVETTNESTIGNIEDGYDKTKDYIGIALDGYKTTVSFYNDYSNVGAYDNYYDLAKNYVLDYVHGIGYPDATAEELTIKSHEGESLKPYTYIKNDLEGIVGKGYMYYISLPEEKYGKNLYGSERTAFFVCYDPKIDLMFIDNKNVCQVLGKEYGPYLYARIELSAVKPISEYIDMDLNFEKYIDYVGVVANITGRGEVRITSNNYEDQNKLANFIELMDQYGIRKDSNNSEYSYMYNLVK